MLMLSEMIKALEAVKKEYGDLPVTTMSDEEGNQENELHKGGLLSIEEDPRRVTIWPFQYMPEED